MSHDTSVNYIYAPWTDATTASSDGRALTLSSVQFSSPGQQQQHLFICLVKHICIVQLMLMDSFISSRHLVALGAVVVRRKQCVFDMSPLWSTTTGSQEHRLYQSKLINALLNWVYHQYFSS